MSEKDADQKAEQWRLEEVSVRSPELEDARLSASFSADPFSTNATIEIEMTRKLRQLWQALESHLRQIVYAHMRDFGWADSPKLEEHPVIEVGVREHSDQ